MARLVLISEGVDFATHEFIGDIVFIGRTQSNQIVIDHSTVSAQHALLLRVGDSYWLKDLNSTNGTQINGVFVTEAQLKDGDTIRFGSVTAVFEEGCRKPCSSRGAKMFGDEYFGLSHYCVRLCDDSNLTGDGAALAALEKSNCGNHERRAYHTSKAEK
jgi:hypothetical protein